jgi:4-diphosphocytidyl-2-C-methyl-D-erythritol kinase
MPEFEFAPAKINLTLEVLGRRTDGYHEVRSLVAFAEDVGDRLSLVPGAFMETEVAGPFANSIAGSNLVDAATAAVAALVPTLEPVRLTLEKNVPVASGIGGGSADAAAALRLFKRADPRASNLDFAEIARHLGADVPACLKSRAAMMTGIGERLHDVALPGNIFAVLANPLAEAPANKTARVFSLLEAPPFVAESERQELPEFADTAAVIAYAAARGNALEKPARALFPMLDAVLTELAQLPGSRLSQLSGAGPTCFALFETADAAKGATACLGERHPDWWIRSTGLV